MEGAPTITNNYTETFTEYAADGTFENKSVEHVITTETTVPKLGLMLVGLGGNNGSTLAAGILAHKHGIEWETKNGMHKPDYYGSFTQCATVKTGMKRTGEGGIEDVYTPIKDLLPTVNPAEWEVSGWDINGLDLFGACKRAKVLEPTLVNALKPHLEQIKPLPAAFNGHFIASN